MTVPRCLDCGDRLVTAHQRRKRCRACEYARKVAWQRRYNRRVRA